MKIGIEWFEGGHDRPQFNVSLASAEGKDPFLTIKGCRIVDGSKGPFVSWPARKMDNGKWFNHCYASEPFAAAVLAEASKAQQKPKRIDNVRKEDIDDDIPF